MEDEALKMRKGWPDQGLVQRGECLGETEHHVQGIPEVGGMERSARLGLPSGAAKRRGGGRVGSAELELVASEQELVCWEGRGRLEQEMCWRGPSDSAQPD